MKTLFLTYFVVYCKFLLYQSGTIVCPLIVVLKHKWIHSSVLHRLLVSVNLVHPKKYQNFHTYGIHTILHPTFFLNTMRVKCIMCEAASLALSPRPSTPRPLPPSFPNHPTLLSHPAAIDSPSITTQYAVRDSNAMRNAGAK